MDEAITSGLDAPVVEEPPTAAVEDIDEEETPEDEAKPLDLSRSTLKRERVRIRTAANSEGEVYETRRPDDFGDTALMELHIKLETFEKLWGKSNLDETQTKQMSRALNQLVAKIIPDAPPADIATAIPTVNKRGLVMDFFFKEIAGTARVMGIPVTALQKAVGMES